jgi:hypothetical protein
VVVTSVKLTSLTPLIRRTNKGNFMYHILKDLRGRTIGGSLHKIACKTDQTRISGIRSAGDVEAETIARGGDLRPGVCHDKEDLATLFWQDSRLQEKDRLKGWTKECRNVNPLSLEVVILN